VRDWIGPYRVEGLLGRGGLGQVYRVLAPDGKNYALKLLEVGGGDQERRLRRIMREIEALALIRHPGVVRAFDAGAEGSQIWVVLELVSGGSLQDVLRREGKLAPRRAAELSAELARTLADLHAAGILHRDLKPDNVLLSEGRTRLADLGLVHFAATEERLTQTGATVGTPGYCAPELLARSSGQELGPSVDIYGLGATLYALLTGRPPFQGASAYEVAVKTLELQPDRPSSTWDGAPDELLQALDAICLRCLAKDPSQRYLSMAALAGELEEVARGGLRAPGAASSSPRWRNLMVGLASMAALVAAAFLATRPGPTDAVRDAATPSVSPSSGPTASLPAPSSPNPSTNPSTSTPSRRRAGEPVAEVSQLLTLGRLARPLWQAREAKVQLRTLTQGLVGVRARDAGKPCLIVAGRPKGKRLRASVRVFVKQGSELSAGLYYGDPAGRHFRALVVEGGKSVLLLRGSKEGISRGTRLGGRFKLSTLSIEERAKGLHLDMAGIKMTIGDMPIPNASAGIFLSGVGEGAFCEFELSGLD
jgi:serine/threonine protein kinase